MTLVSTLMSYLFKNHSNILSHKPRLRLKFCKYCCKYLCATCVLPALLIWTSITLHLSNHIPSNIDSSKFPFYIPDLTYTKASGRLYDFIFASMISWCARKCMHTHTHTVYGTRHEYKAEPSFTSIQGTKYSYNEIMTEWHNGMLQPINLR
jgi:hypothetical protein